MTKTLSVLRAILMAFGFAFLAACGGGDGGTTMPFATAAEVKAAFAESRPFLGAGVRVSPDRQSMLDPNDFEFSGMTSTMVPVVLTLRYVYRSTPTSKVSVGGTFVPELQQILARIDGQDYPAPVLDIREYEGWLLMYASLRAYEADWRVERWVMYHPGTRQFVDCGEVDSIRPPQWGPAVSSFCVQR